MRVFKPIVLALGLSLFAFAPGPAAAIPPQEAAAHMGQTTSVTGVISQVHHDKASGHIFLNMGGRFPNISFYGFVHRSYISEFDDLPSLQGSEVSISGRITEHRGRPQIVITSPDQISVN